MKAICWYLGIAAAAAAGALRYVGLDYLAELVLGAAAAFCGAGLALSAHDR